MSKHRIKAVTLEDDYDDYDEDQADEADEGITAEDKAQLAAGTVAVRAELDDGFPATDQEIQDSLWHYYYDIAKTVTYLKSESQALTAGHALNLSFSRQSICRNVQG
jgi:elongation factor 1 alpha-like protein